MININSIFRPFQIFHRRQEPLNARFAGGVALTLSILSASTFNAFAKELSSTFSPLSLIFISESLTLIFVLMTYGFFPILNEINKINGKQIAYITAIGLLTGVVGPFLWFSGLEYTSAINAGFFSKSEIIFLMVLAKMYLGEPIKREHVSSAITIFVGLMIIAFKGFSDGFTLQPGDPIILAGILCFAGAHVLFRKSLSKIPHHLPLLMRSLCALCFFFIISPFRNTAFIHEFEAMSGAVIPALLGFAFIARFLNTMTFYEALDRLNVSTVSLLSSLTVIGSTIFAAIYLQEELFWYHVVGGMFIIMGTILLELLGHQKPDAVIEQQMKQRITH